MSKARGSCGCSGAGREDGPAPRPLGGIAAGMRIGRRGEIVEDGAPSLGSRLASRRAHGGRAALGAGGQGTPPVSDALDTRADGSAYGARPVPPGRPALTGHSSARAPMDPVAAAVARQVAVVLPGADPRLAAYGLPAGVDPRARPANAGLPVDPAQRGQFLPAPPAPQDVCLVNGFHREWGTPPENVWGVPLPFNPDLGAYLYDPDYAAARVPSAARAKAEQILSELKRRWDLGQLLQPYKRGDDTWDFRWIPRLRTVACPLLVGPVSPSPAM